MQECRRQKGGRKAARKAGKKAKKVVKGIYIRRENFTEVVLSFC